MHWLILDAASECDIASKDAMLPLSTLQLFIYLFAPLLQCVEGRHFSSLKLQHGLKLWEPLWEFHQPKVPSMCAPVRQRVDAISDEG